MKQQELQQPLIPSEEVAFEIIYDDELVISGKTKEEYKKAKNKGIQFVIVLYSDDTIIKYKALDNYIYKGISKPGSWTSDENFKYLKTQIGNLSKIKRGEIYGY